MLFANHVAPLVGNKRGVAGRPPYSQRLSVRAATALPKLRTQTQGKQFHHEAARSDRVRAARGCSADPLASAQPEGGIVMRPDALRWRGNEEESVTSGTLITRDQHHVLIKGEEVLVAWVGETDI